MIWNNGFLFSKFSNILKQFKVLMASWLAFANTNLKCTHYGIFFDKTHTHYIVFSLKYIADIEHNFEMEQIPGKVKITIITSDYFTRRMTEKSFVVIQILYILLIILMIEWLPYNGIMHTYKMDGGFQRPLL